MDLINNRAAIISVGVGGWYPAGVRRLERTLNYHGFFGDIITWKDTLPPNAVSHVENQYNYKLHAFKYALDHGYTHVLWCDASLWCIGSAMSIFDYINEQGVFSFQSGYNCAQSVNDATLAFAGISRNRAETITEYCTGLIGLNFKNPLGKKVLDRWFEYMDAGLFRGSRLHDNQSSDPRFLFHRQEQSCFSLILHELGIRIPQTKYLMYYPHTSDHTIFYCQGM